MKRRLPGLAGALLTMERQASAAKATAAGYPVCVGCGWGCDDPELDLCCDCFDEETARQMKRGDFGPAERAEIRASEGR